MRYSFIKFYDAGAGEGGGDATTEMLVKKLGEMKADLEKNISDKNKLEIKDQLVEALKAVDSKIEEAKKVAADTKAEDLKGLVQQINDLKTENAAIIKGFNMLQTRVKTSGDGNFGVQEKKSFGEALAFAAEEKMEDLEKLVKSKGSVTLELKTVGNMLLSSNLTGDPIATYNGRQGIVPAQKLNIRDLMPTVQSATGLYVTYRETGTEGAIAQQTEGADKGQIDYDLTEVKVVQNYIAGFATFSKQMLKSLPFMQTTLTRMLLRDFYKKENALFFASLASAATGSTTTSETVDVKQLIDYIANQETADFSASYILVSHKQAARLKKEMFTNGYYMGSGSVVGFPNGRIEISGTPIIPASWVTDDKALVIDSDYIERIESDSLRVEFSYENDKNFQKNLITARVECQEEINVLRPDSMIYADLGNVS